MTSARRALIFLVPLALLLLPVVVYAADQITSQGEIARNVTVAGIPVGGLATEDAKLLIDAHEQQLNRSTAVASVNGHTFKLSPRAVALDADTDTAIEDAMAARHDGSIVDDFVSWLRSFSTQEDISLPISFDMDAIDETIATWEEEAIPNPAFDGAVEVRDGEVVPRYPYAGQQIDREAARAEIIRELSTLEKTGIELTVVTATPVLTNADIDAAAAEMSAILASGGITLIADEIGFRANFSRDQLADMLVASVSEEGITVGFDRDAVLAVLELRREEYEIQPLDARFDIDQETRQIRVIPGRTGTLLDVDALLIEMKGAALGSGIGRFPLVTGAQPDFTTEEAQSYTSLGFLASFTTNHPAREARNTNIEQMARDVNGAIVQPGEVFSINEHLGQRTEAGGYVAAPAIINGEPYCCDHPANIGGGVSQFATTMFNAVFFSCLEDVNHRPHSLWFSRYPEGREATLGYPSPDLQFRNNTDAPIIIATNYTDTTITVSMYGDNGGKTCDADTHEREDIVEFEIEYVVDEEGLTAPGEGTKIRDGKNGFLVKVDRIVTFPDGHTEVDLELSWRYATLTEQWLVHECESTGEPIDCPVQAPDLAGKTWEEALAILDGLGLKANRVNQSVNLSELDGRVINQEPAVGEWIPVGGTVTVTIAVFDDGGGG